MPWPCLPAFTQVLNTVFAWKLDQVRLLIVGSCEIGALRVGSLLDAMPVQLAPGPASWQADTQRPGVQGFGGTCQRRTLIPPCLLL